MTCHDDIAIIVPTFNNDGTIADVIGRIRAFSSNIIVVNDGSTDSTADILSRMSDVDVVSYPVNRGKGYALKCGLRHALSRGFRYGITIDSDGQHYPEDLPLFFEAADRHPDSLVIGSRNLRADNMPGKNTFANRFSNFWYWAETGQRLSDTQSGFRLYPLQLVDRLSLFTSGYEFEVEVIVKAAWKGVSVFNIPIRVYYPPEDERVSHFKPLKDFTRISLLNTYLFFMALLVYHPFRLLKCFSWSRIRQFVHNDIYNSKDNNLHIALSIALGVFMGITPLWGYQMIICIFLAHIFGLSKTISVICSNISIPPMIPFILFGSYASGCYLLGRPLSISFSNVSFDSVLADLSTYVVGSFALAFAAAVVVFLLSWAVLSLLRKK